MVLVLNNGIASPSSIAGTTSADGASFDVTISATVSAGLANGPTTAIPLYTKISDTTVKEYGRASSTTVFPAITATGSPSVTQQMLTALNAAIIKLSGSTNSSVSFNGQSFTKRDLAQLIAQRTNLQAQVIAEQNALLSARGGHPNDGRIQTQFASPNGTYPPYGYPGIYPVCP